MNEGEYGEAWKESRGAGGRKDQGVGGWVACMGGAEAIAHVLTRWSPLPA